MSKTYYLKIKQDNGIIRRCRLMTSTGEKSLITPEFVDVTLLYTNNLGTAPRVVNLGLRVKGSVIIPNIGRNGAYSPSYYIDNCGLYSITMTTTTLVDDTHIWADIRTVGDGQAYGITNGGDLYYIKDSTVTLVDSGGWQEIGLTYGIKDDHLYKMQTSNTPILVNDTEEWVNVRELLNTTKSGKLYYCSNTTLTQIGTDTDWVYGSNNPYAAKADSVYYISSYNATQISSGKKVVKLETNEVQLDNDLYLLKTSGVSTWSTDIITFVDRGYCNGGILFLDKTYKQYRTASVKYQNAGPFDDLYGCNCLYALIKYV